VAGKIVFIQKIGDDSARGGISASGADIIPKWRYIRTPSADITKLGAKKGLKYLLMRLKDEKNKSK
jgi:hypothetical protein